MIDTERGTGRTTRQMQDAPLCSIFMWCNDALLYPRHLARSLKRPDLHIVSPSQIHTLRGNRKTVLVVDHAANLTERQRDFLCGHFEDIR